MPDNLPALLDSAGSRYSQADLYRFIAAQTLSHDIGSEWDYSNLDYWLLQEAMAARGRAGFEQLLQKRVIAPLGLQSTVDHVVAGAEGARCGRSRRRVAAGPADRVSAGVRISCRQRAACFPRRTTC